MDLFQLGSFRLASGAISAFKIECDALSANELACLAYLLALRVPAFGSVEGVPSGGLQIAEQMRKYATDGPLLIVDDVWTTGGSMVRFCGEREAIGAVIFARTPTPAWVTPLFQLTEPLK